MSSLYSHCHCVLSAYRFFCQSRAVRDVQLDLLPTWCYKSNWRVTDRKCRVWRRLAMFPGKLVVFACYQLWPLQYAVMSAQVSVVFHLQAAVKASLLSRTRRREVMSSTVVISLGRSSVYSRAPIQKKQVISWIRAGEFIHGVGDFLT